MVFWKLYTYNIKINSQNCLLSVKRLLNLLVLWIYAKWYSERGARKFFTKTQIFRRRRQILPPLGKILYPPLLVNMLYLHLHTKYFLQKVDPKLTFISSNLIVTKFFSSMNFFYNFLKYLPEYTFYRYAYEI